MKDIPRVRHERAGLSFYATGVGLNGRGTRDYVEERVDRRGVAHERAAGRQMDVDHFDEGRGEKAVNVVAVRVGNDRQLSDGNGFHATFFPSTSMVTSANGIVLPESAIACLTSRTRPKQQGTVM